MLAAEGEECEGEEDGREGLGVVGRCVEVWWQVGVWVGVGGRGGGEEGSWEEGGLGVLAAEVGGHGV